MPYYASAPPYFPDDANLHSAGDFVFHSALNYLLSNTISGDYYFFILCHELDHSLGLKHPRDDGGTGKPTFDQVNLKSFDYDLSTVVSYNDFLKNYNFKFDPSSFMLLDDYALQSIYGARMRWIEQH